jgi:hypothetical protein
VKRQFNKEFMSGDYKDYSFERKLEFLKELEDFVYKYFSNFFGNNSGFEKALRYMHIVLLYQQSKIIIK